MNREEEIKKEEWDIDETRITLKKLGYNDDFIDSYISALNIGRLFGIQETKARILGMLKDVLKKGKTCPNCNCGNPRDCCIDRLELEELTSKINKEKELE